MKKSGIFESKRLLVACVAVLGAIMALCVGCKSEPNPDEDNPDTDTVQEESQTGLSDDTVTKPVQEESQTGLADGTVTKPNSMAFLMDVSESMKGYFKTGDSRLLGVVSTYLGMAEPEVYFYGKKPGKSYSKDAFYNALNNNKIVWANESNLKDMVKFMVDSCDKKGVCCLFTDGILSGSNEQIRKNKEYNIEFRETMSKQIDEIVKDKSLGVLLVRYEAKFKGNYYCYNNDYFLLQVENRPYYMVVIGKWKYVKYVEKELKRSNKLGEHYVFFGDCLQGSVKFTHGSDISVKGGVWSIKARVDSIKLDFNISSLPNYMQNKNYWDDNLKIGKRRGNNKPSAIGYNVEINDKKCTIKIDAKRLSGYNLDIKLAYKSPSWIEFYSDPEDKKKKNDFLKEGHGSLTFNLEWFAKGLQAAQKEEYIINNTLKFK